MDSIWLPDLVIDNVLSFEILPAVWAHNLWLSQRTTGSSVGEGSDKSLQDGLCQVSI